MRRLPLILILMCMALPAFALDRGAFRFSRYDLKATVEPAQHVLDVDGTIELRNISKQTQRELSLQISNSLAWRSVVIGGEQVEWLSQPYTSDIDHTGMLSEAIVRLPKPIAPNEVVRLTVHYNGVVTKDATRLTRIGTPAEAALRSDWDEIGDRFTTVRGVGFVVWYPVALDAANLSEGTQVFDALRDWKERESGAELRVRLTSRAQRDDEDGPKSRIVSNAAVDKSTPQLLDFSGVDPVFAVISDAQESTERPNVSAFYTGAHTGIARDYISSAEAVIPILKNWFGDPKRRVNIVELTDPNALPYETGSFFFTPLRAVPHPAAEVALARAVAHSMFDSPRPWIREGLANFGQAIVRERQGGRRAALEYLNQFSSALARAEQESASTTGANESSSKQQQEPATFNGTQPLIKTNDEFFFRTKAAFVWWMLRDMVGDGALQSAIAQYRPADDKDTGYMQRLIEQNSQSHRSLETFFDDWVYRDKGLPQFVVESAYLRNTLGEQTVTAVTIQNKGDVWAEVPVIVRAGKEEQSARVAVAAKGSAIIRISFQGTPREAVVNDGSVPELERRDNVVPITSPVDSTPSK